MSSALYITIHAIINIISCAIINSIDELTIFQKNNHSASFHEFTKLSPAWNAGCKKTFCSERQQNVYVLYVWDIMSYSAFMWST